jgi:glycosyltransferase involved in cell wall biosynthesis
MVEPRESPAPELAVVMPIYNEASNITSVLRDWFEYLERLTPWFVLFALNDGSTDATDKILASLTGDFGSRAISVRVCV